MSDIKGLFLGLAVTIFGAMFIVGFGAALMGASENLGLGVMIGVGVLQLAYIIPVFLDARRKKVGGLKVGLVIGGSLVFLISSGCGLLLLSFSGSNMH